MGGVGGLAEAAGRGKGRQAPRVRREDESTKGYLERFAPFVNEGCGGFRTLARDRRTLEGFHAFEYLRMSAMVFARISPRFWQVFAEFGDGV